MKKILKFPKLVIDEAKNLKKLATVHELARLDKENFSPVSTTNCIYGLMTGGCYSDRAHELIRNCAKRVYNSVISGSDKDGPGNSNKLNGSPKKRERTTWSGYVNYWSPIERFVANAPHEMSMKLIAYLKGERKRLI